MGVQVTGAHHVEEAPGSRIISYVRGLRVQSFDGSTMKTPPILSRAFVAAREHGGGKKVNGTANGQGNGLCHREHRAHRGRRNLGND